VARTVFAFAEKFLHSRDGEVQKAGIAAP